MAARSLHDAGAGQNRLPNTLTESAGSATTCRGAHQRPLGSVPQAVDAMSLVAAVPNVERLAADAVVAAGQRHIPGTQRSFEVVADYTASERCALHDHAS